MVIKKEFDQLQSEILDLKYKFLDFDNINLESIFSFVKSFKSIYKNIIIIGFGASSLNIKALSGLKSQSAKLIILDNLDQFEVENKIANIDLKESLIFSISRSGNTYETYYLTKYMLETKKVNPKDLIILTTKSESLLFKLHQDFDTSFFEHPIMESGRFGIISLATLLPLYFLNVDIKKIIYHSRVELNNCLFLNSNEVIDEAKWYLSNYHADKKIIVILNYSYLLKGFCLWKRQILAESLSKNGNGITPIISSGNFDQHSQFQLYFEGPRDKFYKILCIKSNNDFIDIHSHVSRLNLLFKEKNFSIKLEAFETFNEQAIIKLIIKSLVKILLIAKIQQINPLTQGAVDFIKTKLWYPENMI